MSASAAPFLRGLADDSPDLRLPLPYRDRLPRDTWRAAEVPAGARIEFVAEAAAVEIRVARVQRKAPVADTLPRGLSVWKDGMPGGIVDLDPGAGLATIDLAPGSAYVIWLPAGAVPSSVHLCAIGGTLRPAAERPRWLAYGDSITQGHSAGDPGQTYSAIIARELGLDLWNLGFAGSARGELPCAEHIAHTPAALVTLAFGTNNWTKVPHGRDHLAGVLRDFIAVIRAEQPTTPIVVVSPIVRPDAERTRNPVGATLAELRSAIEATTVELMEADPMLRLVPGGPLVDPVELVDGIHPGDTGHRAIARGAIPVIETVLAMATTRTRN